MIAALFYLQYHTFRNQLATRIKRLQKPRYLVGAVVGGAYLYFYFFRYLLGGGTRGQALHFAISPEQVSALQSLAALVIFIIALLAWLVPHERAALTFTETEVAFLFPAPVSRRALIHYKLMRSQLRILFSALIFAFFGRRFGGSIWIHAAGWWLILATLNLHFIGSSFTRTLLLDHGISNRIRRVVVLLLAAASVAVVVFWAKNALPPPPRFEDLSPGTGLDYLQSVLSAGPARYLLYPCLVLVRPFFAADAPAFITLLGPVLLLLLIHYLWVIYSEVAFEEASLAASQKLAVRVAAMRTGNWAATAKTAKARRAWFNLGPAGPAFVALTWKNLIGVGRIFSRRFWIMMTVILVVFLVVFTNTGTGRGWLVPVAMLFGIVLFYSLFLGPQLLRLDFRQDLAQADTLKTFPMPSWQIALGEILAPVTLLAGFQWLLLVPTTVLVCYLPGQRHLLFLAIATGAALILPALDFLLLIIPNAAVLLFPAWVAIAKDGPRGIEATGQRLVFALGQLVVLLLALIPAALVFSLVYFPLKIILGDTTPIFLAAPPVAVVLFLEAAAGVMLLGKLFDRFDVAEEPA